jgi:Fe-S-cluster containining protein
LASELSDKAWWEVPAHVATADERLVAAIDAAIGEGERRARRHLVCRLGCTPCCIGPFDITALDAARLARGLIVLHRDDAEAAFGVRARAPRQWREMAAHFPGDASNGTLAQDDGGRVRFFDAFVDVPCRALDPAAGACALYAWRPLSCRSFGLPVRCGSQTLPPCSLNFTAASEGERAEALVQPDPDDHEGELLAEAVRCGALPAETIVCAVLAQARDS